MCVVPNRMNRGWWLRRVGLLSGGETRFWRCGAMCGAECGATLVTLPGRTPTRHQIGHGYAVRVKIDGPIRERQNPAPINKGNSIKGQLVDISPAAKSNALSWSRCLLSHEKVPLPGRLLLHRPLHALPPKNRHVFSLPSVAAHHPSLIPCQNKSLFNASIHAQSLEEILLAHGPAARGRDEEDGGGGHAAGEHGVEHACLEAFGVGLDDDGRSDALGGGGAGERNRGVPTSRRAGRVGGAGALEMPGQSF